MFQQEIVDWESWSRVFNSVNAFKVLIQHILVKEKININEIENCMPGTNAVFKVGSYVVKIYAPKESGMDTDSDYYSEIFGMLRAKNQGIAVPRLVAQDSVYDKYEFKYIIMDYMKGKSICEVEDQLSIQQKIEFGQKLRVITDKLNTRCDTFNNIDIIKRGLSCKRWSNFPETFNQQRKAYIKDFTLINQVYVHGDLNPDNIVIDENGDLGIIDFADALIAPPEYELPAVVCQTFCFDKALMKGYFGNQSSEVITENCFRGLLLHDFGSNIIRCNLGNVNEITNLKILWDRLYQAIETGAQII